MALYDEAIKVAQAFVGPAARLFIERQIRSYLKLENPQSLAAQHVEELAKACEISGEQLMSRERGRDLGARIRELLK